MKGAPRSKEFDDVYFSAVDGLAETKHVFLQGNDLPGRWAEKQEFVIAETGFGTGLNFLAAWKLFEETAEPGARLEFISFEKYPLGKAEIAAALQVWAHEFPQQLEKLLQQYPDRPEGIHEVDIGRMKLKLIIGDVNEEIPKLQAAVDCWFLDGFRPKTNPEMWTETVFSNMARLGAPRATFATFTSVGYVKRGLKAAGFEVQRVRGFGTKWHMLRGSKP